MDLHENFYRGGSWPHLFPIKFWRWSSLGSGSGIFKVSFRVGRNFLMFRLTSPVLSTKWSIHLYPNSSGSDEWKIKTCMRWNSKSFCFLTNSDRFKQPPPFCIAEAIHFQVYVWRIFNCFRDKSRRTQDIPHHWHSCLWMSVVNKLHINMRFSEYLIMRDVIIISRFFCE